MKSPSAGADLVARAGVGARVMTARGLAMRVVSIASNLLLIALVVPAELGHFAVVFGIAGILQFSTDLGFYRALLRRSHDPTDEEYAAFAGLQLIVIASALVVGILWPIVPLGFGALEARWHGWMLFTMATMATLAAGNGARIRLERRLEYGKLAVVDVTNVVVQNVGLVTFALIGQFAFGTFIVLGLMQVAVNVLLFAWSPGPAPSLRIARLLPLARGSAGYVTANWSKIATERATPVLIALLFGLSTAGIWSFAFRLAQLLNVTFEGFRKAAIPAAALLGDDRANLRRLATNTLRGTAMAAAPLGALAFVTIPLIGHALPQWREAVGLAQVSVIFFGIAGVAGAALEPVAVAVRGAIAAAGEQLSITLVGWAGLFMLSALGSAQLAWIVAPMNIAPVIVLFLLTHRDVRPVWEPELHRAMLSLATGLALYALLTLARVPVLMVSAIAACGILVWLRPLQLLQRLDWRTQSAGGRL
jgi:O-antigen/teichoic acid export membrane protein